ncbi:MAG TPA: hypothetical protein VFW78_09780 [Bacteroidia bacterium]|nr:hypothetical protein [Bacteroidia bacterium]
MKRLVVFACIIALGFISSCGPGAEEKAAEAQKMADSVASAAAAKKAAEEAALAQEAIKDSLSRLNDTTMVAQ